MTKHSKALKSFLRKLAKYSTFSQFFLFFIHSLTCFSTSIYNFPIHFLFRRRPVIKSEMDLIDLVTCSPSIASQPSYQPVFSLFQMTDFYGNDKNSQHNSSGVHSDVELDSNHNQLNGKSVIDLMVKRDEAEQFSVSKHWFAVTSGSHLVNL